MNEVPPKNVASHHPNVKDITGQQFGKWTVLYRYKANGTGRNTRWLCRCGCGIEQVVLGNQLRTGKSTCCPKCSWLKLSKARLVHGESGSRIDSSPRSVTYRRWMGMRGRSASNKTLEAMRYAKRDLKCCERWSSYQLFHEDMGECPSEKHTIDRIDNNGHYSCGKCVECKCNGWKMNAKWSTQTEQQRNKSSNRMVEYNGSKMCVAEFAERIGMRYHRCARFVRLGWTTERIAALVAK